MEAPLVRGARWLADYWPNATSVISSIGFALSATWLGNALSNTSRQSDEWWRSLPAVCVWGFAAINIYADIKIAARSLRISELVNAISTSKDAEQQARLEIRSVTEQAQQDAFIMSQDFFGVLEQQLRIMANDVLSFEDSERISVYKHTGDRFTLVSRYSKHPTYTKTGRQSYPDNQGCIGVAWTQGEVLIDDLPDPNIDPAGYQRVLRDDWGIPRTTSRGLRMKSRNYAAFAIDSPTTGQRTAVMVFESTRTGVLQFGELRDAMRETESRRLAAFIERMKPFEASSTYAKEEGF